MMIVIIRKGTSSNTEPVNVLILDDSDDWGMMNDAVRIDVIDAIMNGCSIDNERLRRALFKISW